MINDEQRVSWKRLQELYHAAHELRAEDRDRFLDYHCPDDEQTQAQIRRLIAVTEDCSFLAIDVDEPEG